MDVIAFQSKNSMATLLQNAVNLENALVDQPQELLTQKRELGLEEAAMKETRAAGARAISEYKDAADELETSAAEYDKANENEMPENALRETLAAKRKILNDFMEQVAAANMQKVGGAPGM